MSNPVVLQTVTGTISGASSGTVTLRTTAGSMIYVAVSDNSAAITGASDTQSNLYTNLTSITTNGNLYTWYTYNVPGGPITITITASSAVAGAIIVREYSGLTKTDPKDVATSNNGAITNNPTSNATAATQMANELVVAAIAHPNSVTTTAGAGYSHLSTLTNSTVLAIEDKLTTSTGAQTGTFTLGTSGDTYAASVVTFLTTPSPSFQSRSIRPHPFSPGLAR